jgi:hypothetical protein
VRRFQSQRPSFVPRAARAYRSSLSRRASSASQRSEMSSQVVTIPRGSPEASRITSDMSWTGNEEPSLRRRTRSRFHTRTSRSSGALSGIQFAGGERSRASMLSSSSTL